jgi:hypothetical protein
MNAPDDAHMADAGCDNRGRSEAAVQSPRPRIGHQQAPANPSLNPSGSCDQVQIA